MERRVETEGKPLTEREKVGRLLRPIYVSHLRKLDRYYVLDSYGVMIEPYHEHHEPTPTTDTVLIYLKRPNNQLILLEKYPNNLDGGMISLLSQLDELISVLDNSSILLEVGSVKLPMKLLRMLNPLTIDRVVFSTIDNYPIVYLLSRGEWYVLYLPKPA